MIKAEEASKMIKELQAERRKVTSEKAKAESKQDAANLNALAEKLVLAFESNFDSTIQTSISKGECKAELKGLKSDWHTYKVIDHDLVKPYIAKLKEAGYTVSIYKNYDKHDGNMDDPWRGHETWTAYLKLKW